eukprot:m.172466 g.172466  ORF g.172466 m.172466 type:complete len:290 (+) comp31685_c11_seq1:98-967(+)
MGVLQSFKDFLAGGAGGASLVVVGHPLDTAKVKLQTAAHGQYKGTFDVLSRTFQAEGVTGLYRGMAAPLAGIAPIFAVYFWGFGMGKNYAVQLGGPLVKPDGSISTLGIMFGGGFSAIPGTVLMVPGDRIKVMLQATGSTLKGPVEAFKKINAEAGVRGFYKGTALTFARDCPGSVAYYGGYEVARDLMARGGDPSVAVTLTAGGLAGWANWLVAVPPDTIKSRLQSAPPGKYPGGGMQVARELMATGGVLSLYRGLGPALIRAFPANAACFLGYEMSKSALDRYWPNE